jgi:lipopolysaccharide export system protein LptA
VKQLGLILFLAFLALAQEPIHHGNIVVAADKQQIDGRVLHLTGHVTIETDSLILRADSADLNNDANEITPHGDVHLKLK